MNCSAGVESHACVLHGVCVHISALVIQDLEGQWVVCGNFAVGFYFMTYIIKSV